LFLLTVEKSTELLINLFINSTKVSSPSPIIAKSAFVSLIENVGKALT